MLILTGHLDVRSGNRRIITESVELILAQFHEVLFRPQFTLCRHSVIPTILHDRPIVCIEIEWECGDDILIGIIFDSLSLL